MGCSSLNISEEIMNSTTLGDAERMAYPAVFRGLNASWLALSRWSGLAGLQYLQEKAGSAAVEVWQLELALIYLL